VEPCLGQRSGMSLDIRCGGWHQDTSVSDHAERADRIDAAKEGEDLAYLTEALLDPDHRLLAAKYLADLGAVESSGQLIRLLNAVDPHVRIAAAQALGRLQVPAARPRLREVAVQDEDAGVRSWAVAALGQIGDRKDADLLLPLLDDPSRRVRGAAALALGRIGDPKALEPLRAARRKLRKRPFEWYMHRRVYNRAIESLSRGAG
jgi:HEAT repeat protein